VIFEKSIEKLVELKYITVNEVVSISGIAAHLANDLSTTQNQLIELEESNQMFNAMKKYYPKIWDKVMKELREQPKT
ncbi:MAG: hypothetical protein AABY22_28550, partial [Nanoarchaeota archaeon]